MKFLCVCDGGNVRSHALALVLKEHHHHESVAVGRLNLSPESMRKFCEWADKIVILQPHMEESVDLQFKGKLICADIGPDEYGMFVHPNLMPKVSAAANWLVSMDKQGHQDEA